MAYEREQFRIVPDARQPGRWAYEATLPGRAAETVGGFASADAARKAFERQRRAARKPNSN
ncbi:hypothetical protein V5F40_22800 [Xanthobacter sp. DSM 14520]|uniref:hypothetical protein n=1 Tax=Xanthobacter autotrophicus (strain ATCC BAA-1158 / Py2) TaxID=78245 RepID=UPI00372A0F62